MGRMYLDKMTLPDGRHLEGWLTAIESGPGHGVEVEDLELAWIDEGEGPGQLTAEDYNSMILVDGEKIQLSEWAIDQILKRGEETPYEDF